MGMEVEVLMTASRGLYIYFNHCRLAAVITDCGYSNVFPLSLQFVLPGPSCVRRFDRVDGVGGIRRKVESKDGVHLAAC